MQICLTNGCFYVFTEFHAVSPAERHIFKVLIITLEISIGAQVRYISLWPGNYIINETTSIAHK